MRPTVNVGVYDKGEIPKKTRPAYLVLAQVVYKVGYPVIVDQRTGVERNDAERVDGFLAPLATQETDQERAFQIVVAKSERGVLPEQLALKLLRPKICFGHTLLRLGALG